MEDMSRFRERVLDLQRHFGQANDDIEKILTSSEKIASRGQQDREPWSSTETSAAAEIDAAKRRSSGIALARCASPEGRGARSGGGTASQVIRQPDLLAKDS